LGLLVGCFSWIAERGQRGLVFVELLDGGFISDSQDYLIAALFRLAYFPEQRARRSFGQSFVIAVDGTVSDAGT
jgi:hypothetical protein